MDDVEWRKAVRQAMGRMDERLAESAIAIGRLEAKLFVHMAFIGNLCQLSREDSDFRTVVAYSIARMRTDERTQAWPAEIREAMDAEIQVLEEVLAGN